MNSLAGLNFRTAALDMERDEHKEALKELQLALEDKWHNEGGLSAIRVDLEFQGDMGALVRESVDREVSYTDVIPLLFEARTAEVGDTVEIEELINTLRVVRYVPGAQPRPFTPKKDVYQIDSDKYELPYQIPLIQVITGQYEISDFVSMAAEAMNRHRLKLALEAIEAACNGNTDPAGRNLRDTVADTDVDEATLKASLRALKAMGGGNVRIMGTGFALDPIYDMIGDKSETLAEDLNQRGIMGTYRGATLIEIEDSFNRYTGSWTTINGVDLDKLIVLAAEEPGGVWLERDLSDLEFEELEPEDAMFRTSSRLEHGVFVHKAWHYRIIEMTG